MNKASLDRLLKAAIGWWVSHRPTGWTLEQHAAHPLKTEYNGVGNSLRLPTDKALAEAVAAYLAPPTGLRHYRLQGPRARPGTHAAKRTRAKPGESR